MLNHSYVYDTVMSVAYETLDTPQNWDTVDKMNCSSPGSHLTTRIDGKLGLVLQSISDFLFFFATQSRANLQ